MRARAPFASLRGGVTHAGRGPHTRVTCIHITWLSPGKFSVSGKPPSPRKRLNIRQIYAKTSTVRRSAAQNPKRFRRLRRIWGKLLQCKWTIQELQFHIAACFVACCMLLSLQHLRFRNEVGLRRDAGTRLMNATITRRQGPMTDRTHSTPGPHTDRTCPPCGSRWSTRLSRTHACPRPGCRAQARPHPHTPWPC